MEREPTDSAQPRILDPIVVTTSENTAASPEPQTTVPRELPLPVGSLARDVLGEEFVAKVAEERQRAVAQHREQLKVRAARAAHARWLRQYFG